MERSALGTLLGVPAHLYRQAVRDCLCWIRASATGQNVDAFARELRLRFFGGFARTRVRDFARHPMRARTELWRRLPVRLRV
jgi:hypothetical protein